MLGIIGNELRIDGNPSVLHTDLFFYYFRIGLARDGLLDKRMEAT